MYIMHMMENSMVIHIKGLFAYGYQKNRLVSRQSVILKLLL